MSDEVLPLNANQVNCFIEDSESLRDLIWKARYNFRFDPEKAMADYCYTQWAAEHFPETFQDGAGI